MYARRITLSILLAAGLLAPAFAQERIEVTEDGRAVAVRPQPGDGTVTRTRDGVLYGTAPDWQNMLRRQVSAVELADLDSDARSDLVVGCYHSDAYPPYDNWRNMIFYNTGTSLEPQPSWVSADQVHTNDLKIADLNLDGWPDIFAANGGFSFSPSVIYHGSPFGPDTTPDWFSSYLGGTWATGVVIFDVDHDGDLDIFTSNQGQSPDPYRPMLGYLNNAGTVWTSPSWETPEHSIQSFVAAGDWNNDGWVDLGVSKWTNGFQSGVYRNASGTMQTFAAWTTGVSDTHKGAAWGDVDGDGWMDFALGANPSQLWHNNHDDTFSLVWTANMVNPGTQDMRFCDIDRDGDPDLAEVHFSSGIANIYLNREGVLDATPTWSYDSSLVANALVFGDINGDLWPDLVIGYSGAPCVVAFYAQGPYRVADLNCDGAVNALDISPFVMALVNPAGYVAQFPECHIEAADINADGTVNALDINPFVRMITGS